MRPIVLGVLATELFFTAYGCSSKGDVGATQDQGYSGGTGGGASEASVSVSTGSSATDGGGYPTPICDGIDFNIVPSSVAVMLLQDMSQSMDTDLEGKSKWAHSVDAITSFLTGNATSGLTIMFGFDYFPDTAVNRKVTDNSRVWGCGVDDPVVDDADTNSKSSIIDWMSAHAPAGATPLGCALNKFIDPAYAPKFTQATIDKYLILISDGADSCGMDCTSNDNEANWATPAQLQQTTQQLFNKGIKTAVIGFGNGVAPDQLNAIALAGGVFDTYFDVRDPASLNAAFESIANAVVSCSWDIGDPSAQADPLKVNFYFGDEVIHRITDSSPCSTTSGWIWKDDAMRTVEFCGDACKRLRSEVSKVTARFGCPSVI